MNSQQGYVRFNNQHVLFQFKDVSPSVEDYAVAPAYFHSCVHVGFNCFDLYSLLVNPLER